MLTIMKNAIDCKVDWPIMIRTFMPFRIWLAFEDN